MSTPSPIGRATYHDLESLPDDVIGEIVSGELSATPRPAGPHTVATSAASGSLVPPFQFGDGGPGGWWILVEPEVHLGEDVVVPDLAGWLRTRMPGVPGDPFIEIDLLRLWGEGLVTGQA